LPRSPRFVMAPPLEIRQAAASSGCVSNENPASAARPTEESRFTLARTSSYPRSLMRRSGPG
jgi:hypothetical protein